MKAKLLISTILIIAVAFTLGACTSNSNSQNTSDVKVTCDMFQAQPKYSTTASVSANGTLTVTLCSNTSTGFSWTADAQISDSSVLKQTNHKTVASNNNMAGAPSQEVWTFKALENGTAKVSFTYSQPWSGGIKDAWTVNLDVTVN